MATAVTAETSVDVGRSPEAVKRLKVIVALLCVYVVWGSTYYGVVVALEGFPPLLMAGSRHLAAGALLLVILLFRREPLPKGRQWLSCALLGLLFQSLGNGLVVVGSQWVASSLAAVLVASMPLWSALFGRVVGERTGLREWLGLLMGMVGVVVLNLGGGAGRPLGVALVLLAAAAWALGTVWARYLALPGAWMTTAIQMMAGGTFLLLGALVRGEQMAPNPPTRALVAWVYLMVFGSLLGYGAFQFLLRNVPRPLATSYAYVNPVLATLLGVGIAGEPLGLQRAAGMLCILAGVLVIMVRGRPATGAAPAGSQR